MNNNDMPKWASELSADMRAYMQRAEKRDEQAAKRDEQAAKRDEQAVEDRKRMLELAGEAKKDRVAMAKAVATVGVQIVRRLDKLIWLFNGHGGGNGHRGDGNGKRI